MLTSCSNKHGRSTNQSGFPNAHHDNTEFGRLLLLVSTGQSRLNSLKVPNTSGDTRTMIRFRHCCYCECSSGHRRSLHDRDAPAGTGKTFTERTITAHLRSQGKLVLCTASTGIAALVLPGGLTAHSTFLSYRLVMTPLTEACATPKPSLTVLTYSGVHRSFYGMRSSCHHVLQVRPGSPQLSTPRPLQV